MNRLDAIRRAMVIRCLVEGSSVSSYNFGRKHLTLGTTPAVKAGLTDHTWSVEEINGLLEKVEPKSTRAAVSN